MQRAEAEPWTGSRKMCIKARPLLEADEQEQRKVKAVGVWRESGRGGCKVSGRSGEVYQDALPLATAPAAETSLLTQDFTAALSP